MRNVLAQNFVQDFLISFWSRFSNKFVIIWQSKIPITSRRDINISLGSKVTHLRRGGIFNNELYYKFVMSFLDAAALLAAYFMNIGEDLTKLYRHKFGVFRSVCEHISKTRCPNFIKFLVHVVCGHASVLLLQRTYFRFCGWRHICLSIIGQQTLREYVVKVTLERLHRGEVCSLL